MIRYFKADFIFDEPFISGHKFDIKLWKEIFNQITKDLEEESNKHLLILKPEYFPSTFEDMTTVRVEDSIGYITNAEWKDDKMTVKSVITNPTHLMDDLLKYECIFAISPYGFGSRVVDPIKGVDYKLMGFNTVLLPSHPKEYLHGFNKEYKSKNPVITKTGIMKEVK